MRPTERAPVVLLAGTLHADTFVGRLQAADLAALTAAGGPRAYAEGSWILTEGDPGRYVVILRSGLAKVLKRDLRGYPHLLSVRGPGDLVGELAVLGAIRRTASVLAVTLVEAVVIEHARFLRLTQDRPKIGTALAAVLGERLQDADVRQVDLHSAPVLSRVARTLAETADKVLLEQPSGSLILPVTQKELAEWVGAAEISVHKALRELAGALLIETGYGRIAVRDLDGLRRAGTGR